jgi:hypothetical protein
MAKTIEWLFGIRYFLEMFINYEKTFPMITIPLFEPSPT